MVNFPNNPHAIIEVCKETTDARTKKTNLEVLVTYDSWTMPRLFSSVDIELTTDSFSALFWKVNDFQYRLINQHTLNSTLNPLIFRAFLGFGKDLGEPLFKGILSGVERVDSTTIFKVYDKGLKLKQAKKTGYFNKKGDLEILKILAERNGLQFSPPEKPLMLEPHKAIMQDEQTDWEHALERARDSGLHIFVRQDTLFARYPAKLGTPKITLSNRGKNSPLFKDFNFEFDTPENEGVRPRFVTFRGRGKGGKRLEGKSDDSNRGRENVILKRGMSNPTKKKLSARAQAQKELDREHSFQGNLSFAWIYPHIRLDIRDTVRLTGIGNLLSTDYICNTVTYNFAAGEMSCQLDLYRDFLN